MRPFATEVAGIAGWHDGRAINVQDYASEDDDVRYHEAQHSRIFLSTPDGQMLHSCIRYVDKPTSVLERDRRAKFIGQHIDGARIAHETSATFIGVEMCETEEDRAAAFFRLSEPYKAYYAGFSDLIDGLARSSFLRCAIGQAITHCIFSSRAFENWVAQDFSYEALLSDLPDDRWERFRRWWHKAGHEMTIEWVKISGHALAIVSKHIGKNGESVFGSLDDDVLIMSDRELARAVDAWVISGLYDLFIDRSPLISISSGSIEFVELLERSRAFHEAHGNDFRIQMSGREADEVERVNIVRTNAAVTLHQSPHATRMLENGPNEVNKDEIVALLREPNRSSNFLFSHSGLLSGPCLVETGRILYDQPANGLPDEAIYIFDEQLSAKPSDAIEAIQFHMYEIYGGLARLGIGTIVAPFANPNDGSDYDLLKSLLHTHHALPRIKDGKWDINDLQRVTMLSGLYVEYVNSDFYEFIERHRETHRFGMQAMQVGDQARLMILWAEQDTAPQFLMKALPYKFGVSIGLYFKEQVSLGQLRLVDSDIPMSIENASRLVSANWIHL